jgi:hypothetical protein
MTALALFTIRRWLSSYDARTRAALTSVAHQQHAIEQQQAAHEHALKERAAAVTRESATAEDQLRSMSTRLDTIAEGRAADLKELEDVRRAYEEMLSEYNTLVRETLQSTAAQFARKECRPGAGARLLAAAELVPEQRVEALHQTDAPVPPAAAPH